MAGFLSKSQVEYQVIFEFALMEWIRCTPCLWAQRARGHWAEHEHGNKHKKIYFFFYSGFGFILGSLLYLLQNATYIITKCDSYFITICDENWLQNALGLLLQNAQVLLKNVTAITKCEVYYKMLQYMVILLWMNCYQLRFQKFTFEGSANCLTRKPS